MLKGVSSIFGNEILFPTWVKNTMPRKLIEYIDNLVYLMTLKGVTIKQFLKALSDAGCPGLFGCKYRKLENRLHSENQDNCLDVLDETERKQLKSSLVEYWQEIGRFLDIRHDEIEYQFREFAEPVDHFVEQMFYKGITRGKFVDTMNQNKIPGLLRVRKCPELVECFSEKYANELIETLSVDMLYQFKVVLTGRWQLMTNVLKD